MSLFVFFRLASGTARHVDATELRNVERLVATTPGLSEALIFIPDPEVGEQPYSADGAPPPLALQLDFTDIAALETALGRQGHLRPLGDPTLLPSLAGAKIDHQAMLKRAYRAVDPDLNTTCTVLVAYPGSARDVPAWLSHYLNSHCPIMLRFPQIQGLDVYTRIDWCSAMPWERAEAMQRNKTVFRNARDLESALASPVLAELREDVRRGPPTEGGSVHYPMTTQRVLPTAHSRS